MSKDWMNAYREKELAALIAPAIRMTIGKKSIASFFNCEVNECFIADAAKSNLVGARFSASSLEELYDSISTYSSAANIDAVGIDNLGVFVIASSRTEAERKAEALKSGNVFEAVSGGGYKRLEKKIAIVTGSAQGFGDGIAREMAKNGAHVVIADINFDSAQANASDINNELGSKQAFAVKVDVANEESLAQMIEDCVNQFGGLDIFVSNAGVLKAGGLEELSANDFEFVTKINYTAFFLCTKYASRVMKLQHSFDLDAYFDIIQINSKSGLVGSNKNFAYAGGKFGGIGLVQSFAKELVVDKIKVNAICPGNYYDGPLWRDPERGLFKQYLEAGKVPGAKTIDDVLEFYLNQVPMHKGCTPKDVSIAIYYCVEQENETGQAIPVSGGQIMLS